MNREKIEENLDLVFPGLTEKELPSHVSLTRGKVRDTIDLDDKYLLITTDRISAFGNVITTIAFKGEVLNGMSMFWFRHTHDIVPNHIEKQISDRTVLVRKCTILPFDVVMRNYLTGSAWEEYEKTGEVAGKKLPRGMKLNQKLSQPLLTPTQKARNHAPDVIISAQHLQEQAMVEPSVWKQIEELSFRLFERGTEIAAERGLLLVDTRYKFGLLNGSPILVDELHTPDSSRYWFVDTYEELFDRGEKQRKIDKEYLNLWLKEQGYVGVGEPPEIPDRVRIEVSSRYVKAYELVTGHEFIPSFTGSREEKDKIITYLKKNK